MPEVTGPHLATHCLSGPVYIFPLLCSVEYHSVYISSAWITWEPKYRSRIPTLDLVNQLPGMGLGNLYFLKSSLGDSLPNSLWESQLCFIGSLRRIQTQEQVSLKSPFLGRLLFSSFTNPTVFYSEVVFSRSLCQEHLDLSTVSICLCNLNISQSV